MRSTSAIVAAVAALLCGCGSSQPSAVVHGRIAYQKVPGSPFGVATTGRFAFVDLLDGRVLVLSDTSSQADRARRSSASRAPSGRIVLVGDFGSAQLEAVDVATLR